MEYTKVLVPLDGSKLAESVLPHLEKIALGCGVKQVLLVTVTEPIRTKTPTGMRFEELTSYKDRIIFYGNVSSYSTGVTVATSPVVLKDLPVTMGKMAKTGYDYLVRIAKKLEKKGVPVSIAVLKGNVSEEIVHFAEEEKADLIIMASRGQMGLRRWDVANAATKVFRSISIPVLLVKPPTSCKETKTKRIGKAT